MFFEKQKEYFENELNYKISPFELKQIIKDNANEVNVVDVRNYDDYNEMHIPYSIHIPIDDFEKFLNMLDKEKLNIIYCESDYCFRAIKAGYKASIHEYPVKVMKGGFRIWKKLNFETIST